ncbi:hypothetical protein H6F75_17230 [Nodosilinea sp. FACHB-131]|uniref:hypothetical protein n=1 Tax=Cyanophyceae TaxID=3028117 RepID=UPI001683125F|nr:hypothetical protein [Nodosilinea sp. FACHB-131]MBD1875227.1 hypothetical protein [Nodosilinea sp. FACHB-131]
MAPATLLLSNSAVSQESGVEIVNQTQKSLVGLYAVPSGQLNFGPNRLRGEAVGPSGSLLFQRSPGNCDYDFLSVFSDGESVADYNINVCTIDGGTYTLFSPESEGGKLVVFNGTTSDLQEILIEGASMSRLAPSTEQSPATPEGQEPNSAAEQNSDGGDLQAALCEQFSSPAVRRVCYEALYEMALINGDVDPESAGGDSLSAGRSTRVESSRDCTDDTCDERFLRQVGLLGSYVIRPQTEAWILTDTADLSCVAIQRYDVTATFANGQQEKQLGVNLCDQDKIVFGQPQQGEPRRITIANATDQSTTDKNLVLQEIYIASPQSTSWGYNRLESRAIAPGEADQVAFVDTTRQCIHDVRAVFINPNRADHLEPVLWPGINLCSLVNNTLVYGIEGQASRDASQPAIAAPPQALRTVKQLSRSKSEVCLSSADSRVCQPARRRNATPQRPWWRTWRRPA